MHPLNVLFFVYDEIHSARLVNNVNSPTQESHCSPVHHLLFNAVDPRCSNLIASVGGNQVSKKA